MLDDEREGVYPPRGFECNICLDVARDPVVTFCGHLYCWPCIYKWIHLQSTPSENLAQLHPQCPVCKSDVSQRTMVPLYGRGQVTKTPEDEVPERPPSLRRGGLIATTTTTTDSHPSQQPQTHQSNSTSIGGTTTNVVHPMIGETPYAARISGNSSSPTLYSYPNSYHLSGSNTLRMRRHQLHADDKSLGRIHCFLLCCVVICLILL